MLKRLPSWTEEWLDELLPFLA
ncbi:MAG: hypothetical protein ACRDAJ_01905 [Serratia fonticola]